MFRKINAIKLVEPIDQQAVWFILFMGVCFSIFRYNFVSGIVQYDMLPIIYRMMDPDYLINDLFTNSSANFNEDYYFAKILASISTLIPIPILFFGLTILTNIFIGLITFRSAKYLFQENKWVGIIAVVLVYCMDTMKLGYGGMIVRPDLVPSQLSRPLILASIYFGIRNKALWVGLLAAISTLIHPLEGAGTGLMVLSSMALVLIFDKNKKLSNYTHIGLAAIMIFAALLLYVIPYFNQSNGSISDELFIEISIFRFPHHYLPSFFLSKKELLIGGAFLASVSFSFLYWKKLVNRKREAQFFLFFLACLVIICIGGYLFVEVWASRIWLIAQTWRFLIFLKWIGILLISGYIWHIIEQNKSQGFISWVSCIHPFTLVANLLAIKIIGQKLNPWIQSALTLFGFYLLLNGLRSEFVLMAFFILLSFLLFSQRTYLYFAGWVAFVLVFLGLNLFHVNTNHKITRYLQVSNVLRPHIYTENSTVAYPRLAVALKEFTPKDAVILSPAIMSELRLTAERALVVDFAAIPMEDVGMKEWYDRIRAIHKANTKNPWLIRDYDMSKLALSDEEILDTKTKYHADFAILDINTITRFPVVYQDKKYQLVQIKE